MNHKYLTALAVIAASALLVCGCGSPGKSAAQSASTTPSGTITMWSFNESTQATKDLITSFETKYPGTTVTVIDQPGSNYFALLQASVSSGKAPDVFTMFPGGYQQQFADYSLDLSKYISRSDLEAVRAQYLAKNSNLDNPVYGVPTVSNMYYMLYNQNILSKAGVAKFPSNWTELNDTCQKVTVAGYLCLGYGNSDGAGGFDAYEDFSYLAGKAVGIVGLDGLIGGTVSYNDQVISSQVAKWAKLQTSGFTNKDVMTWRDVRTDFTAGKTAMYVTGSWDAPWALDALGDAVHAAPAPFSDTTMNVLIRLQDSGLSVSADTKNPVTATAFANYVISTEGQEIIAKNGGVPSRTGVTTNNRINQEILANSEAKNWTVLPMFDNFIAPAVNAALRSSLNQVLAGQLNPNDALSKVDDATKALTTIERIQYHLSGK